jgi:hypothetical protein
MGAAAAPVVFALPSTFAFFTSSGITINGTIGLGVD